MKNFRFREVFSGMSVSKKVVADNKPRELHLRIPR